MEGIPEVAIGYGVSDEFRYLFSNGFFFFFGRWEGVWEGEEKFSAGKKFFISFFLNQARNADQKNGIVF